MMQEKEIANCASDEHLRKVPSPEDELMRCLELDEARRRTNSNYSTGYAMLIARLSSLGSPKSLEYLIDILYHKRFDKWANDKSAYLLYDKRLRELTNRHDLLEKLRMFITPVDTDEVLDTNTNVISILAKSSYQRAYGSILAIARGKNQSGTFNPYIAYHATASLVDFGPRQETLKTLTAAVQNEANSGNVLSLAEQALRMAASFGYGQRTYTCTQVTPQLEKVAEIREYDGMPWRRFLYRGRVVDMLRKYGCGSWLVE
jgi:hypothetical protein